MTAAEVSGAVRNPPDDSVISFIGEVQYFRLVLQGLFVFMEPTLGIIIYPAQTVVKCSFPEKKTSKFVDFTVDVTARMPVYDQNLRKQFRVAIRQQGTTY